MGVAERRAREKAARRKSVLDAARGLVKERGFNGTTTKEIARACELSEAALFFHFKSKDEILTSLLSDGIELMRRGIEALAAADLPASTKLERLWAFFQEIEEEHPELFQVFAYLAHPRSTASVSEEVIADLAKRSGDNFRALASLLTDIVDVPDPRVAADLLWGTFIGLMVLRDSRTNLGAHPHPTTSGLRAVFELMRAGLQTTDQRDES